MIENEEEKLWRKDIDRMWSSPEALFQHTIMMDILQRHSLDADSFEYSCDTLWRSKSFPRWDGEAKWKMGKPKPDLTVGFNETFILPHRAKVRYVRGLVPYMRPEDSKRQGCAFPFFFMEVKGSAASIGDDVASLQAKNDAAQALFNIWKFMKTPDLREKFAGSVRVFTATAHAGLICVRMHRAQPRCQVDDSSRSRDPTQLELWYESKAIMKFSGTHEPYKKSSVLACFHNILYYAKSTLQGILKEAVDTEILRATLFGEHGSPPEPSPASTAAKNKRRRSAQPQVQEESLTPADSQAPDTSFLSNDSTNMGVGNMNIAGSDTESHAAAGAST